MKQVIGTASAPAAIGTYSQAIKAGSTVFLSGQIPLDPDTMECVTGDFAAQVRQVFHNLQAVAQASGGDLKHIVKLTVYLLDMDCFATVNDVMAEFISAPFPARAVVAVVGLPRGAAVEMDAIMILGE